MMSTTSGFVLGVLTSATLTVLYGEQLSERLQQAVAQHPSVVAQIEEVAARASLDDLEEIVPEARRMIRQAVPEPAETAAAPAREAEAAAEATDETPAPDDRLEDVQPSLEQRWADYASQRDRLEPSGEFPWRVCFQRAAASYELPEALLIAIASGESNFDPAARSHADAVGLMQVRWPLTSKHLGIYREADLYDPCTNVDAGARYVAELATQYDDDLHLVVAAYNYGPSRISAGNVPEGARWYSQYIYQHLQQVLGRDHIPTSELIDRPQPPQAGHQVLMTFNQAYRARDYLAFLRAELPELKVQQQSEALGYHDVVLLYEDETERRAALLALQAAGIATLDPQPDSKLYL